MEESSSPSTQGKDVAQKVDAALDRLLVEFGKEILQIIPGKVSTEVDARFSFDTKASVKKALHIVEVSTQPTPSSIHLTNIPQTTALQNRRSQQGPRPHQNRFDLGRDQGRPHPAIRARHQL